MKTAGFLSFFFFFNKKLFLNSCEGTIWGRNLFVTSLCLLGRQQLEPNKIESGRKQISSCAPLDAGKVHSAGRSVYSCHEVPCSLPSARQALLIRRRELPSVPPSPTRGSSSHITMLEIVFRLKESTEASTQPTLLS